MSIHSLPLEITLKILSYLPIQSICSIEATSTSFRDLISTNRDAVYRAAAFLHGFVEDDLSGGSDNTASHHDHLQEALKRPCMSDWLRGVNDWKEFCRKHFTLERVWQGAGPGPHPNRVRTKSMRYNMPPAVSKFKVDEVERTAIATTQSGQLLVVSIDTQECLWSLPRAYLGPGEFVALEASGGFVVVVREERTILDVWRRSVDCFNPSTYLPCSPSPQQIQASPEPVPLFPPNYPPLERSTGQPFPSVDPTDVCGEPSAGQGVPRRGVYLPFAELEYNEGIRKVHVCYPYMAVSVLSGNGSHFHQIDVWGIPSMARRRTLRLEPPALRGDQPTPPYMEQRMVDLAVGDEHVYVCWDTCIAVYAWGTVGNQDDLGHAMHVDPIWRFGILDLHAGNISSFIYLLPDNLGGNDETPELGQQKQVNAVIAKIRDPLEVDPDDTDVFNTFDEFIVCPRGMDIVAITTRGWIVYIPNSLSTSNMLPRPTQFRLLVKSRASGWQFCTVGEPDRGPPLRPTLAFDGKRILFIGEEEMFCIPVVDRLHPTRGPAGSSDGSSGPPAPERTKLFFHFTNLGSPMTRFGTLEVFGTSFWFIKARQLWNNGDLRCLSYVDFTDFEPIALLAPRGSAPVPELSTYSGL